ncbi:MAG: hypothetical protein P8Y53_04165 [Pseudolabrys sp.]
MSLIYLYLALAIAVAILAKIRGRPAWLWFLIAVFATPLIGGLVVMALPRLARVAASDEPYQEPYIGGSQIVPMPANSTIRVIRLGGFTDRFRPYRIRVNGALVGTVPRNCVVDFHVPSGELVVEACIDWGGSRPLMIETEPGSRVDLEVRNRWGPVLAVGAMIVGARHYLDLRPAPGARAGAKAPAATAALRRRTGAGAEQHAPAA